jgi:hypothetical protein
MVARKQEELVPTLRVKYAGDAGDYAGVLFLSPALQSLELEPSLRVMRVMRVLRVLRVYFPPFILNLCVGIYVGEVGFNHKR